MEPQHPAGPRPGQRVAPPPARVHVRASGPARSPRSVVPRWLARPGPPARRPRPPGALSATRAPNRLQRNGVPASVRSAGSAVQRPMRLSAGQPGEGVATRSCSGAVNTRDVVLPAGQGLRLGRALPDENLIQGHADPGGVGQVAEVGDTARRRRRSSPSLPRPWRPGRRRRRGKGGDGPSPPPVEIGPAAWPTATGAARPLTVRPVQSARCRRPAAAPDRSTGIAVDGAGDRHRDDQARGVGQVAADDRAAVGDAASAIPR